MSSPGVFISHSCQDKHFARRLARDLQSSGAKVWIDEAELNIGDSLIEKIRRGIDSMDFLAVLLSRASVASEWVKKEVDIAMNQEIKNRRVKVLPILVEDCQLPGFLVGKVYADCTSESHYQDALPRLRRAIGLKSAAETGVREEGPLNVTLIERCADILETQEEKETLNRLHTENRRTEMWRWLLRRLTPPSDYLPDAIGFDVWSAGRGSGFWTSRSPESCSRMSLLVEIAHEIGAKSDEVRVVRDNLVCQYLNDSFAYDPEFNDRVQMRFHTIAGALKQLNDHVSLAALDARFKRGQFWEYETRPREKSSRILVVQGAPRGDVGLMYHICIDGVSFVNPYTGNTQLPVVPISAEALEESTVELEGSNWSRAADFKYQPFPEYDRWRGFLEAKGGLFTVPVAEIVERVERWLQSVPGDEKDEKR